VPEIALGHLPPHGAWYAPAVSKISQLLEVQNLDLASDRLREQRRTLPEREALLQCRARAASVDDAHTVLLQRRADASVAERELGAEVAVMANRAQEVEDRLYSGTVKVSRELQTIQEEGRILRERQARIEERQMELLEEIERIDGEIADNRSARHRTEVEEEGIRVSLGQSEAKIDDEIGRLARQRRVETEAVPASVLVEYERLRSDARLAGRAAAALMDGGCGGCRVRLPVHEYNQMRAQAEDALLVCSRCGRVLVR
jgi:predicted  nucleic acid-binding Zn-ribbon protein